MYHRKCDFSRITWSFPNSPVAARDLRRNIGHQKRISHRCKRICHICCRGKMPLVITAFGIILWTYRMDFYLWITFEAIPTTNLFALQIFCGQSVRHPYCLLVFITVPQRKTLFTQIQICFKRNIKFLKCSCGQTT